MSAAQVQSQQQALEAFAREQVALQVAEVRKHSEHLVASAQQAQLLVFQQNEHFKAQLAEWQASKQQPTSPYGDNHGEIDLTGDGQGCPPTGGGPAPPPATFPSLVTQGGMPRDSMMNLEGSKVQSSATSPILSSAQPKRGRPSVDTSPGSHQAGPGSAEPERSRSPSGRDRKKDKKDKRAKISEQKIRKMRSKHNATSPVQKVNFDNGEPFVSRTPLALDVSDFSFTSEHVEQEYDPAEDEA